VKILITGGAGFIGSHLARMLVHPDTDHEVVVLDNLSTGSHDNIKDLFASERFTIFIGDVTSRETVKDVIQSEGRFDLVYHLASAVGVKTIMEKPVESLHSMLEGTQVIAELCSQYHMPVVFTSTSEVYGNSQDIPFKEDTSYVLGTSMKRRWSYACAKAMDEFVLKAYHDQYALPMTIVRLFNCTGPGQSGSYGMVVPRFIQAILNKQPVTIYGDGLQSRTFCHVDDAVEALIDVGLHIKTTCNGKVYNVGSTQEISILDLAKRIHFVLEAAGYKIWETLEVTYVDPVKVYGPGFEDMKRRCPDISKIGRELSWTPNFSLDDIILGIAKQLTGDKK